MKLPFNRKSVMIIINFLFAATIFSAPISEVVGVRYEISDPMFIRTSITTDGLMLYITGQGPDAFMSIKVDNGIFVWEDPSAYEAATFTFSNKNWKNGQVKYILIDFN